MAMTPFSKMHALGNDFVVIDNRDNKFIPNIKTVQKMAHRHLGVGFDQLLMVTNAPNKNTDFGYQIFNANGQEVGQCGNGARCLAHFILHHKISTKKQLTLTTNTTTMQVNHIQNDDFAVTMPCPTFEPETIPFTTNETIPPFQLTNQSVQCYVANVGNPHAIITTNSIGQAPIETLGKTLGTHAQFPQGTNVSFMHIENPHTISLRVYERGAGITLACGSAACAAMAIGRQYLSLAETVTVKQPGGELKVTWPTPTSTLTLQGPSTLVFTGVWRK
jgi:diaminopimelate epimerase